MKILNSPFLHAWRAREDLFFFVFGFWKLTFKHSSSMFEKPKFSKFIVLKLLRPVRCEAKSVLLMFLLMKAFITENLTADMILCWVFNQIIRRSREVSHLKYQCFEIKWDFIFYRIDNYVHFSIKKPCILSSWERCWRIEESSSLFYIKFDKLHICK